MRMYSVKDIKAEKFAPPFPSDNDATASRAFQGSVQGQEASMLSAYPEDFQLFFIGNFNEEHGEFDSQIKLIVSGSSFSRKEV